MTTIRFTVAGVFALVCLLPAAFAQDAPRTVNGGIVNGKAISLPKPVYPEAARVAGVGGVIAVDIVIDEAGTVISAEADPYYQRARVDSDGNKLDPVEADASLREAAENAAMQARFAPTMLSGQPVQVKGRIVYNFVADKGTDTEFSRPGMGVLKTADTNPQPAGEVRFTMVDRVRMVGGVLNDRADPLPKPAYPAAARAVRAEGTVVVEVTIDESGSVTTAQAVSGHPLLRAAAEKAALEAKFRPWYVDGNPVKVSGIVNYTFVL